MQSRPKTDNYIRLWNSDACSELMVRADRCSSDPLSNNGILVWLLQCGGDSGYYGWADVIPRCWCMPTWAALMNSDGRIAIGLDEIYGLHSLTNGDVLFCDQFIDWSSMYASLKVACREREQFFARRSIGEKDASFYFTTRLLSYLGHTSHSVVSFRHGNCHFRLRCISPWLFHASFRRRNFHYMVLCYRSLFNLKYIFRCECHVVQPFL